MAFNMLRGGLRPTKLPILSNAILRMASSTMAAEASDTVSWDNARPYEEIPGPKPLPIIGNLHQFIPGIGDMANKNVIEQQRHLMNKYGKIVKVSNLPGRRDTVFLFDPKYYEEMFRNEGPWPDRDMLTSLSYYRKVYRKEFFEGVGGLLAELGEPWKKFRAKVNPPMMQPRIANRYLQPIVDVSNDFIKRTKSLRDSKSEMPKDYVNELNKWALESITMIAFDKRLGCLESNLEPDSESQRMIDAVEDFFECSEIMELRPPLWKIISTPTWRRYTRALDFFTEVVMRNINETVKRMQEREPGDDYEPSVIEKILLRDSNPKTAYVMALDMLTAGVDTTSFNAGSLLYHLSKNQEKQQRLFKEIVRFLPNRNDIITIEMIEDMKYLKACIKESMRMSGIVTVNMRGTTKDVVIGNYRIPKDVNVQMPLLLVGQMDEYYPHASRFIPERWLKSRPGDADSVGSAEDYDDSKAFSINPFVFLPFGFGPRMCIGRRFAELELSVLITKLVRNFQVEFNYGDIKFSSKLLHKPISPLKFKMTDRTV